MIIGFTGRARHGKSTASLYLHDRYGFRIASFAEPLKRLCYEGLLVNPPPDVCAPDRCIQPWDSDRDYWYERLWNDRSAFSRWLLQFIGTEIGRALNPNLWVDRAIAALDTVNHSYAFADVRFQNEADAIRANDGIVVHVIRAERGEVYNDAHAGTTHSSEKPLAADYVIYAEGVNALYALLDDFMHEKGYKPLNV